MILWKWARRLMLTLLAILGATLFGFGATTEYLTGKAEQAHPPVGRFVTAEGRRLHVIDSGEAGKPPLVFIHGAFGAAEDFKVSVMPNLTGRFRAVAIDRPGHGYSERGEESPLTPDRQAAILRAGLKAAGIEGKPILVGFSLGGAVALAWGLNHPDDVAGILLINPASHPWPTPISLTYEIADAPLIGPLFLRTIVTPVGHLLKDDGAAGVFKPAEVPPNFAATPLSLSVRPATYAANAEDIRTLKPYLREQAKRYPDLKPPLLILVSDKDGSTSPQIHSHALAREVPGAELIEVTGGGHPLHFSRPADVLAAVERIAAKAAAR